MKTKTSPRLPSLSDRNRLESVKGRGFTLVELVVALFVVGLIAALGLPAIFNYLHRVKIEGMTRQTRSLLQEAKFEAIKRAGFTVVAIDPDTRDIVSFVDVHGVALDDPADGIFNPVAAPIGATDFEMARFRLPIGVEFRFQASTGLASVEGFANTGNPDPPDKRAIFRSNGSALSDGALRFGDERGNYFEVRVSPAITARVEVRKWDGAAWRAFGEEGEAWVWH